MTNISVFEDKINKSIASAGRPDSSSSENSASYPSIVKPSTAEVIEEYLPMRKEMGRTFVKNHLSNFMTKKESHRISPCEKNFYSNSSDIRGNQGAYRAAN